MGSPATRARVEEIVAEIERRGNVAVKEYRVDIVKGEKRIRFADVAEIDPTTSRVIKYHQVGETTTKGKPVSRERRAIKDIEKSGEQKVEFHNRDNPSSGGKKDDAWPPANN